MLLGNSGMTVRKGMFRCPESCERASLIRGGGGRDTGNQRHASYGDFTLQNKRRRRFFCTLRTLVRRFCLEKSAPQAKILHFQNAAKRILPYKMSYGGLESPDESRSRYTSVMLMLIHFQANVAYVGKSRPTRYTGGEGGV